MALIIQNISGAQLAINDLGIELGIGDTLDLTLESTPTDVARSARGAGFDLFDLITAGSLVVKDPNDDVTNLTSSEGIIACRVHNQPGYKVLQLTGNINQTANGQKTFLDNVVIDGSQLVFKEDVGTNVVGFEAPAAIATDVIWTLPATDSTGTQALVSNGSGVLSWQTVGGSDLTIEDEGTPLTTAATKINFAGAGVTATEPVADEILVTIPGIVPSDMASVTVGRSSNVAIQTTWTDVDWQNTHVENDVPVLEHDNVNIDRIQVKETGLYFIAYSLSFDADSGEEQIDVRVRIDDTTVVPGSVRSASEDDEVNDISNTITAELTAGTFLTLQTQASGTGNVLDASSTFMVTRATGMMGAQGPAGSGSTIFIEDEGTAVAGGPHSTLDFVGAGVTVTNAGGGEATVTINAGGDVSSTLNLADNSIVRGDGGVKGVQDSLSGAIDWTIADSGRMQGEVTVSEGVGPPFTTAHFGFSLHNTLNTGGGGGLEIRAGEVEGDIAFRICDENGTLNILDVHADNGQFVLGTSYDATFTANSIVYGIDNQHAATKTEGEQDFNTQFGVYRVAGTPVTVGTNVIQKFTWDACSLQNPINANWAVNALAPASPDSNNAGLMVRRFDDTTDEGVGFMVNIPSGATDMTIRFKSRAETAPGGVVTAGLDLYRRDMPDNAAVSAWSAALALTAISLPANENWQYDEQTITLATLGLTAGETVQFELVRNGGTLVGDWTLLQIEVEFSEES